jgi:hypothetical protein
MHIGYAVTMLAASSVAREDAASDDPTHGKNSSDGQPLRAIWLVHRRKSSDIWLDACIDDGRGFVSFT